MFYLTINLKNNFLSQKVGPGGVCLHDNCFWCLAKKRLFKRSNSKRRFFFPKRQKLWFWCWLQPPGSLIPCLHLPSRLLSSSAPKKFLQYLALFVFYPDVKSTSFSGAIASWKPSSTSIKKRCPVKRRNFPTKRRNFFRGDFDRNLQHISIHRARIAAGQRGSKKTSPIKWNAFFCLKRLFFWDTNFFGCSRNAFFLLPVDLGIHNKWSMRQHLTGLDLKLTRSNLPA